MIKLENISVIVANNLKKLREERNISLDKVSELTGVSKNITHSAKKARCIVGY